MDKEIKITCEGSRSLPIDELEDFQGNLKEISKENFKKLKKSILKHGFSFPVFVWGSKLIDGHQRIKATKALLDDGYYLNQDIPVVEIEADNKTEAGEKLLALNNHYAKFTEQGVIDFATNFEIDLADIELELPDINIENILGRSNENEGLTDEDTVPDKPENPTTKTGDLWLLGQHRLLCGDSTKIEDVERLMDGQKADMVFTDPPYNINFKPQRNTHEKIKNDNMSGNDFIKFLNDAFRGCYKALNKDTYLISFMGWSTIPDFKKALSVFFEIKSMPIWRKNNFGIGYYTRPQYEPFFLCLKGNPIKPSKVPSDVFDFAKVHKTIHSCEKPVGLIINIIDYFNKNGLLYEPFLGSGSTIIACEKTNRKCYGIELDLKYCDVILKRWSDYTGEDPIRDDGVKYSDLTKE